MGALPTPPANALAPQLQAAENLLWDSIKESHRSVDFIAYLEKFPNGVFAGVARDRLVRVRFDGVWSLHKVCPEWRDQKAFTRRFTVRVTEGVLDLWVGTPNTNGSEHLHGEINSDGTASLEVIGSGGDGKRYQYLVPTKFADKQGFGTEEGWPCEFTFTRQTSGSALSGTGPPADALAPQSQIAENLLWDSIKESHRSADFNAYLKKFPNGLFAQVARNRLASIAFDGVWSVKKVCPEWRDAKAFTTSFAVMVAEGVLDVWSGSPNTNGSWHMHGAINSDGIASLEVTGLSGNDPKTSPQGSGKPYLYHVSAKFTDKQGFGNQVENWPCEFTFTRKT